MMFVAWIFIAGCWILAAGCCLFDIGFWLLLAGCWLALAGCCFVGSRVHFGRLIKKQQEG
ncbi:MAG: hypothetical protein GY795_35240 [Desulfobacterales bacterium]|nr:hypothetical protein [Desulfobacterales bacterium]